jgi:hypothetical protein
VLFCSSDVALSYMHAQDPCAKFLSKTKITWCFWAFWIGCILKFAIFKNKISRNFHKNMGLVTPHLCPGGGLNSRAHRNTCRVVAEILGLVLMEILEKKKYGSWFCVPNLQVSWYYYLGLREELLSKCFHLSSPQLNGTLIP